MEKGLSVEECVRRAEGLIEQNGMCLLLLDMKDSRTRFPDTIVCREKLTEIVTDLNHYFAEYLPPNSLASLSYRDENGFRIFSGDSAMAGINSSEVIPRIILYQETNYPEAPFYWSVAEDGYDNEGFSHIGC